MGKGSRETKFGVEIDDPFRWLEEESEETIAWQNAQNAKTDDYFAKRTQIGAMRARIGELLQTGYCELPQAVIDELMEKSRDYYSPIQLAALRQFAEGHRDGGDVMALVKRGTTVFAQSA